MKLQHIKMIHHRLLILLALICLSFTSSDRQQSGDVRLSEEELKLYNLIMEYREEKGLSHIPLSSSLTYVAQQHCRDLADNKPDRKEKCNPHSWSNKGEWKGCCYTVDHKNAECMWEKPGEMTNYTTEGYEIAAGSSDPEFDDYVMTAAYAVEGWKKSKHHNNVMINKGIWKDSEWKAIGIGIYKGFATVWFGTSVDEAGKPKMPEK